MNTELGFWARLVLAVLATWRVTHLLAKEDGPADIIFRLRSFLGNGILGKLMDCFYCLSIWVAAPMTFFVARKPLDLLFVWLALSGAACLLERTGREPVVIQPLSRITEKEKNKGETNNGMLRTETGDAPERAVASDNGADHTTGG